VVLAEREHGDAFEHEVGPVQKDDACTSVVDAHHGGIMAVDDGCTLHSESGRCELVTHALERNPKRP
jgi:hypothetical protein